ncbi:MAG: hypothetical protein ABSC37_15790 [Xanthobacteraceae bacterium]
MRKDEDDIRQFMPALRRIIILVAVLTAVPVVMWTITAFVRTYVGPPKLPTFQPMTASTLTDAPASTAEASDTDNPPAPAAEDADAAPLPRLVEARATTTDARSAVFDIKKPPVGAVGLSTAAAPAPADPAANIAAPSSTASAMPSPIPNSMAQFAAQEPPAPNWPAVDSLPPAEPIAGPVPLPRQRPRVFAMVQTGVPLPRARPASASEGTPGEETPFHAMDDRLSAH